MALRGGKEGMPRGAKGGRHVVVTGSTEVACHVAKGSREGRVPWPRAVERGVLT